MKQHARRLQTSTSSSSRSSRKQIQILVPLALVALVVVVLSSQASLMEARYLPTRADESDLAVLEDLIRLVLEDSKQGPPRSASSSSSYYRQQPFQVRRRSMEEPHLSSGDSAFRSLESQPRHSIVDLKSSD